ncbi:HAD hydrolase-like protein [Dokdonella sp.]|uniref:HAD hydrolase-like protein n=1 Tax=Dokdonella sp. TaxID=2291710 RepID=UPI003C5D206B
MALILLDLDGTLIDSEVGITTSMVHAMRSVGVEQPSQERMRSWIGPPLHTSFAELLGEDEDRIDLAVHHYRERFDAVGWSEHAVYPGIEQLIVNLAGRGNRLAIVTSKVAAQARRIVDHLPFGQSFEAVFAPTPEARTCGKAELVASALSTLGRSARDAVMIGDRCFDMNGARANGVRAIGVLWGFGSSNELLEAGADHIVADPRGLEECLAVCLHGQQDTDLKV